MEHSPYRGIGIVMLVLPLGALALFAWKNAGTRAAAMAWTSSAAAPGGPTVINVSSTVVREGVKRFGMNLGGEDFYDSLQLLKNLVSRNPGFEGLEWQTVIQCGTVTPESCADATNSGSWPTGFLDGGNYEVITGTAKGKTGTISHSTASNSQIGVSIQFAQPVPPLSANDFIVVRKTTSGDATAGWDPQTSGGAAITTEYKDLSPNTPGTQAVRITALRPGQSASLKAYFDSTPGQSYLQLRGPYVVRFRAKGLDGNKNVVVALERAWKGSPGPIFRKEVALTSQWRDYALNFDATESRDAIGTLALDFSAYGAEILVDDVSLSEATSNGTAFRNDVVATLLRLKPGVLRYMDSGGNWGSTLDNMLAPEFARKRTGYNRYASSSGDIAISLHDFLVLCEKIGAEPWYTVQMGTSTEDAAHLMEYLGGPPRTKYGAMRAALGHPVPWTKTFSTIHLEYGNEAWNAAQTGAAMPDAAAYSERATTIFSTLRSSPSYAAGHFDLIVNGQAINTFLTKKILETAHGMDTIDIAPYIFNTFADDSSVEHIFGPMLAEPQMIDSEPKGYVHLQADAAHSIHVAVYETGMGTTSGTASQASIDSAVPSLGAGLAAIDHMLLMLRDLGITVQNTFELGGGRYNFNNTAGTGKGETSPVWATVIDMGGPTNRVRPAFLAQQIVDEAIRPTMLAISVSGEDPTWNQPLSANDTIELKGAKELQSFAFTDAASSTLVLLNLSRTAAHSVAVAGQCAPQGTVSVHTLTSAKITDSNELDDTVKVVTREDRSIVAGKSTFLLPPFSLTTLSSSINSGCAPSK